MPNFNLDRSKPKKHKPMGKEEVVRDDDTGRITEVRADEQVSADSDHAVQVPDEVARDADDFENTRSDLSPAEFFAQQEEDAPAEDAPADEPSDEQSD